uniref:SFRICE_005316 n=1 Tax=Spodoptera frugiperda TaxID=7108 RepID=A0A2H1WRY3_SPOFR
MVSDCRLQVFSADNLSELQTVEFCANPTREGNDLRARFLHELPNVRADVLHRRPHHHLPSGDIATKRRHIKYLKKPQINITYSFFLNIRV